MYSFIKLFIENVWYFIENLLNKDNNINIFEMEPDWNYRGEGNCNVVLSLPKTKKILRIRKIDKPKSVLNKIIDWLIKIFYWYLQIDDRRNEIRDLKFYMKIMRPLLGKNYVSTAESIELSRKDVRILQKQISKYRPGFRKHKILHFSRTTVFDDFAFLPNNNNLPLIGSKNVFAVEIKPKQGWRPFQENYFPNCIFCLHQNLKKENNEIKEISRYCPEDLFSGNETRMKRAIKSLIETPQNNFRIFKNGNLCYGDGMEGKFPNIIQEFFENVEEDGKILEEEFCAILQRCLVLNNSVDNSIKNCQEKLFCEWNKIIRNSNMDCKLPKDCVLERILSVQMLDTEGCYYYYKLLSNAKGEIKDWRYVDHIVSEVGNYPGTCLKCIIMKLSSQLSSGSDLIYAPYLISAIAKDLSLMVTFGKVNDQISSKNENVIQSKYGNFLINIGIFDLYPKPLSAIKKHYLRNTKILQLYRNLANKEKEI